MKNASSRSPHRRLVFLLPLLLAGWCGYLLGPQDNQDATGAPGTSSLRAVPTGKLRSGGTEATSPDVAPETPVEGAAWARLESDGFTRDSRELAAALDAGSPLCVRAPDGAVREFLIRPRRLLGDDFQITLGDDRRSTLAAGVRAYEGLHADSGVKLHAAIAGGAFAAEIEEADGATTYLRTDEITGALRQLRRTREQKRFTCEHDPVTGIASTKSEHPPVTDEDWRAAPEAGIAPVMAASSGFDPGTGRLDKYVQPLAWGHHYEISLRDNLAIVTLDKLATGANTTARLTQITSEYLAKSANLASIQENNLGVRYMLQELILTPDDAAYGDVPVSLGDYGWWISQRRPRGTYGWDLSTRFGNGGFSGGTIGVAWVRSLGTTSPVNTCQRGYNVELEAHEQGHNMGSDHSSGGIMGSGAQVNAGIPGTRDFFTDVVAGETSAKQIWDHASSRLTGSVAMRHAEEIAWAMDDTVNTPVGVPVDILPLANDRRFVRNGITNAVLRIEEVSRVYPMDAGTAEVIAPDRIRFTPAAGYQGQAWFSYSLRGSVGNGGAGWLHKGDLAVGIGAWDRNNLNLRLAPGQEFSFRPSSNSNITIVSQPTGARVDTARDDRHLIIIRVQAWAEGSSSFLIERDGAQSTVNLTYVTDFLQTRPDFHTMQPGQTALRFSPMANDQGAGYRNMADVRPILGEPTANAQGVWWFPGAFRLLSAAITTPAKGSIVLSTRRFTLNSASTPMNSGQVTFTPAPGARGVARISYTVRDAAGATQTNTATIILPLGEITAPTGPRAVIAPGHGITLDAVTWPATEAPLSGVITAAWTVASAPAGAVVTFDNAAAARTGAAFSHAGSYTLRLTLSDSGFSTTDEVTVIVEPSATGPTDSLVAWWKLDESAGTQALDASGSSRHGILAGGAARGAGVVGSGSLTFDGTNDFVELSGHAAAVQNLAQGSISLWFLSNTASLRPIFSMSDNRDANRYLRIYLENGIVKYKVLGDLGTDVASLASPGTANDNLWHHAAVTVDASRNAKLYLDGALVREGVRPFCNAVFNLNSMAIGRTVRNGGTEYWRGGVDDVRIYSRPLAGEEVLSLARLSENRGPVIALGAGPLTTGSRSISTSVLTPAVSDDGKPNTAPSFAWSASGPGAPAFNPPAALTSTVTASADGTWRLRLEASDGAIRTWRETPAVFDGSDPGAPWCIGFTPVRAPLSSPPVAVNLHDVFGDPDGTDDALTFTVTGNSNAALFSSVNIAGTSPRQLALTFADAAPGVADLTVRATDAGGAFVEGTLRVTVENFAPVPAMPVLSLSENAPLGTVAGTLTATDPEGAPLRYAITAGNVLNAFTLHPVTGVLSVSTPFALDYETRPVFVLTVRVSEAAQPASFTDATVLVSLANANEPPVFAPQYFTLRTGTPAGATAGTLSAGDPEGHAITFAITGGNTGGAFSIGSGGVLTVANPAALDIFATPRFTLTVTATDDAATPAVTAAAVRVTLEQALVAAGAPLRYFLPNPNPGDGLAWTQRLYADSFWTTGATGIGYDTGTDYDSLLATDVESRMFGNVTSIYLRIPFQMTDPGSIGRLTLRMKYDDGYWAWINGTAIAHHGAPDPVAWNSAAVRTRDEEAAVVFRDDDVSAFIPSLAGGLNTLAIQGLNESATSSDLLILPELVWSPAGTAAVPDLPGLSAPGLTSGPVPGSLSLRGGVAFTGGTPTVNVTVWWGRVDGGENPAGWENSAAVPGSFGSGWFDHDITGLLPGTLYYVRYSATHSGGEAWSLAGSRTTSSSGGLDFVSWLAGFPAVPPSLAAPDQDADADGLTNFMEYALGGNPSLAADAAAQQPVVAYYNNGGGSSALDFTWRRRLDRNTRGLIYEIELAPAPAGPWTFAAGTTLAEPSPTGDGLTEQLTQRFTVPPASMRFIRQRVRQDP